MKYRELAPEEALGMLASTKKPIEVEVEVEGFRTKNRWIKASLSSVCVHRKTSRFYCIPGDQDNGYWYDNVRVKIEPKMRPMNKFELAKKIDNLRYDTAISEGYVWMIGFNYSYNAISTWNIETTKNFTYAKFDLQGNKISEDFKFEVEE